MIVSLLQSYTQKIDTNTHNQVPLPSTVYMFLVNLIIIIITTIIIIINYDIEFKGNCS